MNTQEEEWEPELPLTQFEHLGPLSKILSDMDANNYLAYSRKPSKDFPNLKLKRDYPNVQEKEESKEISEEVRRVIPRTTEEVEQ